jgi:hypothetical protein
MAWPGLMSPRANRCSCTPDRHRKTPPDPSGPERLSPPIAWKEWQWVPVSTIFRGRIIPRWAGKRDLEVDGFAANDLAQLGLSCHPRFPGKTHWNQSGAGQAPPTSGYGKALRVRFLLPARRCTVRGMWLIANSAIR